MRQSPGGRRHLPAYCVGTRLIRHPSGAVRNRSRAHTRLQPVNLVSGHCGNDRLDARVTDSRVPEVLEVSKSMFDQDAARFHGFESGTDS
jgi:hypothetical protein